MRKPDISVVMDWFNKVKTLAWPHHFREEALGP